MKRRDNGKQTSLDTLIGANTVIEGLIYSERSVSVEGKVRGRIEAKGEVIVGRQGKLEADITADNVVVGGYVAGNITAHGRMDMTATGRVTGDIEATRITIEEGGGVNGLCRMLGEAEIGELQVKRLLPVEAETGPEFDSDLEEKKPDKERRRFALNRR
ncbi:MAG: polymer-forming cytoskeletal protein [Deltaproteobacteria bacterium]|nr:MAG: polymer-forming cytoskeletal protein [Deltaproteobacteria bacterium]